MENNSEIPEWASELRSLILELRKEVRDLRRDWKRSKHLKTSEPKSDLLDSVIQKFIEEQEKLDDSSDSMNDVNLIAGHLALLQDQRSSEPTFEDSLLEGNNPNYREDPATQVNVYRLEPTMLKGQKIDGLLASHSIPTTYPDIIEATGKKYGGGKYQIKILSATGRYMKSAVFEIAGLPKKGNSDTN